jgi:hypothetical protein
MEPSETRDAQAAPGAGENGERNGCIARGKDEKMIFATFLNVLPGYYSRAIKIFKNPEVPEGVKVREALWMFGKPDAVIIFEAENETCAGDFVVQFGEYCEPRTALAFPVEKLHWTLR